jgi:GDP-L-fucose synthase
METYNDKQFVNIGSGTDISIKDLALLVKKVVGYKGELTFNTSKPDGTPRTLMDVSKLNKLGWSYKIHLEQGIEMVYADVLQQNLFN